MVRASNPNHSWRNLRHTLRRAEAKPFGLAQRDQAFPVQPIETSIGAGPNAAFMVGQKTEYQGAGKAAARRKWDSFAVFELQQAAGCRACPDGPIALFNERGDPGARLVARDAVTMPPLTFTTQDQIVARADP